jgi:hypothetical protein
MLGQWTMVVRVELVGLCWIAPFLPTAASDADDEGVLGGP